MKFLHTSDLHIGKIVHEFSMLKDQKYILDQIIQIVKEEEIDAVIVAGDIYDRSIPPAEAVSLLDEFFHELTELNLPVIIITGNHDSPERVSFASRILDKKGLYISGSYNGSLKKVVLEDEYGDINIYLVPFMKPQVVKHYLKQDDINTYEDSVRAIIDGVEQNQLERNLLVTHHFVTNQGNEPIQSDSENQISVGGIDNIDISAFEGFDYVALGHIHRPQKIGRETIRYAGSPLKYSFSEVHQKKSVTIVEMKEKGNTLVSWRELMPLHDMRIIKGKLSELLKEEVYGTADTSDYIQAILTDEQELVDPIHSLRAVYPNTMQLILEKKQNKEGVIDRKQNRIKNRTPIEIFREFYEKVTEGSVFTEEKENYMNTVIDQTGEAGLK